MSSNPSQILRRVIAHGVWTLESPAHFGGGHGDTDLALQRSSSGELFIPASSLAGCLRSYLARRLQSAKDFRQGRESDALQTLFGGSYARGDEGVMSCLLIEDGRLKPSRTPAASLAKTAVRDGVRIASQTGTAAETAKFDLEVIEPKTRFCLDFELLLRAQPHPAARVSHDDLVKLFALALKAFHEGEIALGAKTRRGFGKGRVESWEITDLPMNTPKNLLAWLDPHRRPSRSFESWLQEHRLQEFTKDDLRSFFEIDATFEVQSSLLLRSPSEKPNSPDVSHLSSGGAYVFSGTSWAGLLRHRCERILRTLARFSPPGGRTSLQEKGAGMEEGVKPAIACIFGDLHEGDRKPGRGDKLHAGRLFVEETKVEQAAEVLQTRVAIDRWTGGASDQALFEEAPLRGSEGTSQKSRVRLRLRLEDPKGPDIGLLLLALKDLWFGLLPIGGQSSIGRGSLRGLHAQVHFHALPSTPGTPHPPTGRWNLTSSNRGLFDLQPQTPTRESQTQEDSLRLWIQCVSSLLLNSNSNAGVPS